MEIIHWLVTNGLVLQKRNEKSTHPNQTNEPLIHQFLKRYQLPIPFEYQLIFVNPKFILYGAKPNESIIFPGQIPPYLDSLKKQTISPTLLHTKIIETLLNNHKNKLNMLVKPEYHYEELAKGVFCNKCCGRMERVSKKLFMQEMLPFRIRK